MIRSRNDWYSFFYWNHVSFKRRIEKAINRELIIFNNFYQLSKNINTSLSRLLVKGDDPGPDHVFIMFNLIDDTVGHTRFHIDDVIADGSV